MMYITLALLLCSIGGGEGISFASQQLTEFPAPENLTTADTQLQLYNNKITYIPEGAVCSMIKLNDFRIQHNQLSTLGNLSCVGETLLKLYADDNPLKVVPAESLEGLVKLQILWIHNCQLTAFPELLHVRGTLLRLHIGNNPNIGGHITQEEVANLTQMTHFYMNNVGRKGYPTFLTAIPNIIDLNFGTQDLEVSDDDILTGLPAHTRLRLWINNAKLTRLPHIDSEFLIPYFNLNNNNFPTIRTEDVLRIPQVTELHFHDCKITAMPNFTYISKSLRKLNLNYNPLKVINRELLNLLPDLTHLYIAATDIAEVPCVHQAAYSHIDAQRNELTEIPCIASNVIANIRLDYNKIERIDVRRAATIGHLGGVWITGTPNFVEVDDYMNLELQSRSYIDLKNTGVNLCKCEHAWMKVAEEMGGRFVINDVTCEENGEMWSDMNSTTLLQQCDSSSLKGKL